MKPLWKSKTFWVNLIVAVIGIIGEMSAIFPISKHPLLYINTLAVLNIILRLLTKEPVVNPLR